MLDLSNELVQLESTSLISGDSRKHLFCEQKYPYTNVRLGSGADVACAIMQCRHPSRFI